MFINCLTQAFSPAAQYFACLALALVNFIIFAEGGLASTNIDELA